MDWTTPGLGLRIGGHRGAAGEAPENTFAGFALAAAAGAHYLELDVRLASDGVALVFHDDDLDRTTDGIGRVADRSGVELLTLDAGGWFGPGFSGQRIPTLDGFLAWLNERPGLGATIEAKGPGSGAAISRAIARLRTVPTRAVCSICSFSADQLRAAAAVDPSIPRMLIVDRDDPGADPFELAAAAGATAVNVPIKWLTAGSVARLQAAGLLVAGGTVDEVGGVRTCLELGIDLVDTNRPTVVVAAWKALIDGESIGG
jgi:glycerophosphoryl diester phosphodiesterase